MSDRSTTVLARRFVALTGAVLAASTALAGPGIRVACWNISNYAGGRGADIQNVVYGVIPTGLALAGKSMDPDVLLGVEMVNEPAAIELMGYLNSAPGSPGDWSMEIFTIGPDTNTAFFYRTSKVTNLGSFLAVSGGSATGAPRNVMRYDWRPVGYSSNQARCAMLGVHQKAGNTATDISRRQVESQAIMNYVNLVIVPQNPGINHMILGDFNVYAVNEPGYQLLTGAGAGANKFFDPINKPGSWHAVSVFNLQMTQDPVGPMDDRFDQILVSSSLINGQGLDYIGNQSIPYSTSTWNDPNHSQRAWGNDGQSFGNPLRTTGNTMVGASIAQSIINAATAAGGHIPLFADFKVPAKVSPSVTTIDFGTVNLNAVAQQNFTVSNGGNVALFTAAGIDNLDYSLAASSGFSAPGGSFAAAAGAAGNVHVISMDTSSPGPKSGTLTVTSDDVDNPTRVINLVGTVSNAPPPCTGDINNDGQRNTADLTILLGNFGSNVAPNTNGDLDGNGFVNTSDLLVLLGVFGVPC